MSSVKVTLCPFLWLIMSETDFAEVRKAGRVRTLCKESSK